MIIQYLKTVFIFPILSVTLTNGRSFKQGRECADDFCSSDVTEVESYSKNNVNLQANLSLVWVGDYEKYARATLDSNAWNYFNDGATTMYTVRENTRAYKRYQILPRSLVDVSNFSMETEVLGETVKIPIGISPTSYQLWAYPEGGDNATAKAAEEYDTIFISSAYASVSLEDIAEAAPAVSRWQQLYLFGLREYTLDFARRAEENGYTALVITVDRPTGGIRYSSKRGQAKIPDWLGYPNIKNYSKELEFELVNPAQDWDELKWLRSQTSLPIVLKGVLSAEDVPLAAEAGVNAILVSNHGGRVVDGVPSTIDMLQDIVEAARGTQLEVYLDGGIRTGMDVFKAIALGAKMVFIGRPMIWGLVYGGQTGVADVLDILSTEFMNTAQMCGAANMTSINRDMVKYLG